MTAVEVRVHSNSHNIVIVRLISATVLIVGRDGELQNLEGWIE